MKILYTTVLIVALSWLFACKKYVQEIDSAGPVLGEKVEMVFGFSTPEMSSPAISVPVTARGVTDESVMLIMEDVSDAPQTRAELNPVTDEDLLEGLWVIQFDDATDKLMLCDYHSSSEIIGNKLNIALYDVAATTTVYFVGNVAEDKFSALVPKTTTRREFESMTLDFADEAAVTNSERNLPMVGRYKGPTSIASADIGLQRMAAKLVFTCKIDLASASESFSLRTLQLKNVANKASYPAQAVPTGTAPVYPAAAAGNFMDYDRIDVSALTGDAEEMKVNGITQVWYLPENLRGVVAGLGERQKGGLNAPVYATYVEVGGIYTQAGESFDVVFRFYPGANASTDFNVVHNYKYAITSTIKGVNKTDLRVVMNRDLSIDLSTGKVVTANCYLVPEAGTTYKFAATAMGNGATTPAYNANGQNAPAIVPEVLDPESALVLWETGTEGSVIKKGSLRLEDGYVYFTTAGSYGSAVAEGNALIGVFSGAEGSGTLLWSWHIWATAYNPERDNDIYVTKALTASEDDESIASIPSRTYTVMKYNLGADATSAEGTVGRYGLYYQWGRKDPFIGARTEMSAGTDYAETHNASGYAWENQRNSDVISTDVADASIAYAIQHPTTFLLYRASPYDWMNVKDRAGQRDNLWGNPDMEPTLPNQEQGSKSIYDPCPVGWRVAPQDTWTMFAKNGLGGKDEQNVSGPFNYGWNFYYDDTNSKTAFYPAVGYLHNKNGALSSVGDQCYVWSSSPHTGISDRGGCLSFATTDVFPMNYGGRSKGFVVRCVKE